MSADLNTAATRGFAYEALPGRVVFGPGSARCDLAEAVAALGVERLLLIAAAPEAALADELAAPLGERVVGRFDGVRPHVPVEAGAAAVAAARAANADAVFSVGGGSTTGTAKAVALATGLPIVAVPTTYAGSEMTPVWGSTEGGTKTTGRDLKVLPRLVVYDPELTTSLPAAITAASGMNALAHCVEALYAPGRNPLTSVIALEASGALARALPGAVAAPADLGARSEALYGAYLAGSAFAVAGSGLHHKICHALGGAFDLPHAATHSVVLPHVVSFQQPATGAEMDRVAAALGAAPGGAAAALFDLAAGLGVPLSLAAIGMPADGADQVVDAIVTAVPADNPRPVDADGVRAILAGAYAGERP
ncbi:MAG TPA: maleylacetate reductase [Solirubrobacterales bacterium]|jgi:alcohol dehydrogenase class IV|nr:maleylacetate reductase [Solirubrobacterales bacterium]